MWWIAGILEEMLRVDGGSGGCLRTATELGLGGAVAWGGAFGGGRLRLGFEGAEGHGTDALPADVGDAENRR